MYGTPLGRDPQSRCASGAAAVADSIDDAAAATASKHAAKLSGETPVRCIALHSIQTTAERCFTCLDQGPGGQMRSVKTWPLQLCDTRAAIVRSREIYQMKAWSCSKLSTAALWVK